MSKKTMTLTDELIKYSEDIIDGNIIACQKHKWACQRFLDDLERQNNIDFPFIFVESKAQRFFDWMQLFKHTKGPLAGEFKIPEPVETFFFGQIYGWVFKKTRFRRFRQGYWQLARKNAKSQDLAIVGTFEMSAFGEPCSEVIVAATKRYQTMYVWKEADLILRRCDILRGKFKTSYNEIKHLKSDSIFRTLSKDDKTKDDGSNPQCGIIDEYHAHEDSKFLDVLTSGMKARVQPILLIITTAGENLDSPCYRDEYDYIQKLLDPENPIENDRYLALVCELDKDKDGKLIDDIKDEKNWLKSNPILAKTEVGIENIRAELKIALDKPEKMRDFLTKTMNVWVSMREFGYMDMAEWNNCKGEIPDLRGKYCTIGGDLSAKWDLTSFTFEFSVEDLYYVISHSFMPENMLEQKIKTDSVPYDLWVKDGYITLTTGNTVDYRFCKKWMLDKAKKNGWRISEICMDPWGAGQLSADLIDEGYEVVEVRQGMQSLSEPTKDFKCMVKDGRVVHDGNPVLSWAMGNAMAKLDHNENMMLAKDKSKQRIDPAAATMNSHYRCMLQIKNTGAGVYFA